jgi:hypothetical protein
MRTKERTVSSVARELREGDRPHRASGPWRFLTASLVLAMLYVGIHKAWLWAGANLMRSGWSYENPAEAYAREAAELTERSRPQEAVLDANVPRTVYLLGVDYGYLSWRMNGSSARASASAHGTGPDARMQGISARAGKLGIDGIRPLPANTHTEVAQLMQRLEADVDGVAGRVERVTSPRLRHVFMLGVHVGAELAGLETSKSVRPVDPMLIGKHGTLAGVPEPLWRLLARVSEGDRADALTRYQAAAVAVELNLGAGLSAEPPSQR